ncbi:hypothetical protein SAMN04487936_108131 [Halobacillus dabanensis]|uniref:Uncharacterized protein n=1 Tax=Halobacillus dabanensis TaxID=240302 RepID=A0A1I3XD33_HALDA|nr:hypothetical protein [Halobacillus dabanensis]SFK17435.1 hypothetical protein SAMN04487936_108131 [Halobacillus dabanensis]
MVNLGGPLPSPLRKYETYIKDLVLELGLTGKADEFIREGKAAVYRIQRELGSSTDDLAYYTGIREHIIRLIIN